MLTADVGVGEATYHHGHDVLGLVLVPAAEQRQGLGRSQDVGELRERRPHLHKQSATYIREENKRFQKWRDTDLERQPEARDHRPGDEGRVEGGKADAGRRWRAARGWQAGVQSGGLKQHLRRGDTPATALNMTVESVKRGERGIQGQWGVRTWCTKTHRPLRWPPMTVLAAA